MYRPRRPGRYARRAGGGAAVVAAAFGAWLLYQVAQPPPELADLQIVSGRVEGVAVDDDQYTSRLEIRLEHLPATFTYGSSWPRFRRAGEALRVGDQVDVWVEPASLAAGGRVGVWQLRRASRPMVPYEEVRAVADAARALLALLGLGLVAGGPVGFALWSRRRGVELPSVRRPFEPPGPRLVVPAVLVAGALVLHGWVASRLRMGVLVEAERFVGMLWLCYAVIAFLVVALLAEKAIGDVPGSLRWVGGLGILAGWRVVDVALWWHLLPAGRLASLVGPGLAEVVSLAGLTFAAPLVFALLPAVGAIFPGGAGARGIAVLALWACCVVVAIATAALLGVTPPRGYWLGGGVLAVTAMLPGSLRLAAR